MFATDVGLTHKPKRKKGEHHVLFEEPLIPISLEPTEEEDPLFIDPTAESINDENEDEFALNGFSIFSPKALESKRGSLILKAKEALKVKQELSESSEIKVKDEPKEADDDFELDLPKEEELDPVEAFAQALDKVEYLCPKCTYRSTHKEEVSKHFASSHRVFQLGKPRPCDKCDFIGKTVRELANHKKVKHPRTYFQDILPTLPTGEFKCPHCDFNSFHKNNVRSHMKVHTQDTVYTCDKCPYTAISRLNIENHAARHLVKRNKKWKFKCPHCGLMERTEKLLQMHLVLHGEGEMIKCQMCPYKSPYSHIISMHTRICHGIVSKRHYDKEEKWKLRVRKSTRRCARKTYSEDPEFEEDFEEEFLELPTPKYKNKGRRKKVQEEPMTDNDKSEEIKVEEEEVSLESTNNSNVEKTEEIIDTPRRPTLEERLGRARELINQHLSKKKRKSSESDNETSKQDEKEPNDKIEKKSTEQKGEGVKSDCENLSGSEEGNDSDINSDNHSIEEETGSKGGEDWSDEDMESYGDTADDSMQSFASDKAHLNLSIASPKDNENSMTDSEGFSRAGSSDGKSESGNSKKRARPSKGYKKLIGIKNKSDNERDESDDDSVKRLKIVESEDVGEDIQVKAASDEKHNEIAVSPSDNEVENRSDDEDSGPAVLVLKRNGSSFTCIPKTSTDSS